MEYFVYALIIFLISSAIFLNRPSAAAGNKGALFINRGLKAVMFFPLLAAPLVLLSWVFPDPSPFAGIVGTAISIGFVIYLYGLLDKGRSDYGKKMRILRSATLIFLAGLFAFSVVSSASNIVDPSSTGATQQTPSVSYGPGAKPSGPEMMEDYMIMTFGLVVIGGVGYVVSAFQYRSIIQRGAREIGADAFMLQREKAWRTTFVFLLLVGGGMAMCLGIVILPLFLAFLGVFVFLCFSVHEPAIPPKNRIHPKLRGVVEAERKRLAEKERIERRRERMINSGLLDPDS